jgi:putative metallohydrolase (TIGR04338 family)
MTRSQGEAALRGRDTQREKVYRAERIFGQMLEQALQNPQVVVSGSTLTLPPEAKFSSPEAVQGYVDQVLKHVSTDWLGDCERVLVRKRKGARRAHYQPADQTILVPDGHWTIRESVILHELAHHFEYSDGPAHGPYFVRMLLTLVDSVMGPEAEQLLGILFEDEGVKVR